MPANITAITVTADGASGASGADYVGGNGGEVKAIVPVTSEQTLYVVVGGEGGVRTGENSGAGGFNGDGNGGLANGYSGSGGYGGGGASDVRMQSTEP